MDRDICILIGTQGKPLARTALGADGLLSPGLSISSDPTDQCMLLWVPNPRKLFQDLKSLRLKTIAPRVAGGKHSSGECHQARSHDDFQQHPILYTVGL